MLSCTEVTKVGSDELERPLKLGEQVSLRAHLMMRTGCTNYRRQLKVLRHAMQVYAEGKAIPDDPASPVRGRRLNFGPERGPEALTGSRLLPSHTIGMTGRLVWWLIVMLLA